jgi:hypothetical protein
MRTFQINPVNEEGETNISDVDLATTAEAPGSTTAPGGTKFARRGSCESGFGFTVLQLKEKRSLSVFCMK